MPPLRFRSTFNRERSTHIESKLGDDEGTNASEGGDLGVAALDEVKDGLKLVHDFECFVFPVSSKDAKRRYASKSCRAG